MAFLYTCPCKVCGHRPEQHADLLDVPCSTDHCTVCDCEEYEPSCGQCDACLEEARDCAGL